MKEVVGISNLKIYYLEIFSIFILYPRNLCILFQN
jgi:hypothetical protein